MNDVPGSGGFETAPISHEAAKPPMRLVPSQLSERLETGDLRGVDLSAETALLPQQLAGADLTGARLPDQLAGFEGLGQVEAISKNARAIFIALLAACLYSWLTIASTTDVALIVNTASSPLPFINTNIPIADFYVVGAAILATVYCYFHFYLLRLWRALAGLPAIFPDGRPLDDHAYPWLLTGLVRAWMPGLQGATRPLAHLEHVVTVGLAWGVVPLTLCLYWQRYLPARYAWGTTFLVLFLMLALLFGVCTYRLARQTLKSPGPADTAADGGDQHSVAWRTLGQLAELRPNWTIGTLGIALAITSASALRGGPHPPDPWIVAALNAIGVRTYADLSEVDVAQRPDDWNGQDLGRIKQVDLSGRDLSRARAGGAFLAKADLEGANLQGAVLSDADLQGADLKGADVRGVDLRSAGLRWARLDGSREGDERWDLADMSGAHVDPVAADIDAWIAEATEDIANELLRSRVIETLKAALADSEQPAVPTWSAQPRVWFEKSPEGFGWDVAKRAWTARDAYEAELAGFLGALACAADGPVLTVVWRALREPERFLARRLAQRLLGEDCPPAGALPEAVRGQLEKLKQPLQWS